LSVLKNNITNSEEVTTTQKSYIVSKVFLENENNEILLLRRSKTAPHRALKWDLPGGWVESGEEPLDACARELEEEAGIVASKLQKADETTEIQENETIIRFYAKGTTVGSAVKLSYEHDTYIWVSKKEFLDYMKFEPYATMFKKLYPVTE
jgi:mutator protein MutT